MSLGIRMTAQHRAVLAAHCDTPNERFALALGQKVRTTSGSMIIVQRVITVKDQAYLQQSGTRLTLPETTVAELLQLCCQHNADTVINIHTHPFAKGAVHFSAIDDKDDQQLDRTLRRVWAEFKSGQELIHIAMVTDRELTHTALRLIDSQKTTKTELFTELSNVNVCAYGLPELNNGVAKGKSEQKDSTLLRQKDFILPEQQRKLSKLHITLVGCGGLGSILAETLIRTGVRKLTLIDDDRVEVSNLNRLQGIQKSQVGEYKAQALANHLSAVGLDATIQVVKRNIFDDETLNIVKGTDLMIGAVDNNTARTVLNQLALQYLIPYLDCASVVQQKKGKWQFDYRNTWVIPGQSACLACYPLLDLEEFAQSCQRPELTEAMRQQGYIKEDASESIDSAPAPSVYALNQLSAGQAMMQLLNMLCGWQEYSSLNTGSVWEKANEQRVLSKPKQNCPHCSKMLAEPVMGVMRPTAS